MELSYTTVPAGGQAEFVEKRSRFIGTVLPVTDEQEALAFVAAQKKTYWDARHNVWAFVLRKGGIQRFSDDGEPQGTAGMPVLSVLQKEGITDCAVVVTRYFGGILLGGGGLVRAYSHTAGLALAAAGRCVRRLCAVGTLTCDYAQYGAAAALIPACGGTVEDTIFADTVTLHWSIPTEQTAMLQAALTEQSAGQLQLCPQTEEFRSF